MLQHTEVSGVVSGKVQGFDIAKVVTYIAAIDRAHAEGGIAVGIALGVETVALAAGAVELQRIVFFAAVQQVERALADRVRDVFADDDPVVVAAGVDASRPPSMTIV